MKVLPLIIMILCFGFVNVSNLFGQEKPILVKGKALDLPPDKTVPMTNTEIIFESLLGKTYITKTNLKGEFEIVVPAGMYNVKISLNEFTNSVYENTLINETHNYLPIEIISCPIIETEPIEIKLAEPKIATEISDQPLIKPPERIKIENHKINRNNHKYKKSSSLKH